jgi:hypothetical protein
MFHMITSTLLSYIRVSLSRIDTLHTGYALWTKIGGGLIINNGGIKYM